MVTLIVSETLALLPLASVAVAVMERLIVPV